MMLTKEVIEIYSNNHEKSLAKKLSVDRYAWSIENYFRYFMNYKRIIVSLVSLTCLMGYFYFSNKSYEAKVSFNVNSTQNFKSNILGSSLLSMRGSGDSFSNLVERSYNLAKSRFFFQELSKKLLNSSDYTILKDKITNKTIFGFKTGKLIFSNKEERLNHYIDQIERVISVRLMNESQIHFSVTTKDKDLTLDYQNLLKDFVKDILIQEPLAEAKTAAKIINDEIQILKDQLLKIDNEFVEIQNEHGVTNPEDLSRRYSQLRINIQEKIIIKEYEAKSLSNKKYRLQKRFKNEPRNFELQDKINEAQEGYYDKLSEVRELKRSLKKVEGQNNILPQTLVRIQTLKREQGLSRSSLSDLNAKKALADISIQKIKEAINFGSIDESIKTSSLLNVIGKIICVTTVMFLFISALLYYKQSFFPTIFSTDILTQTNIQLRAIFTPPRKTNFDEHLVDANKLQVRNLVSHLDDTRSLSFTNTHHSDPQSFVYIYLLVQEYLERDKSVYILNFNLSKDQKKLLVELKDKFAESFTFENINSDIPTGAVLDPRKIQKRLSLHANKSISIINGIMMADSPNKAIIGSLGQKSFSFISLFKTKIEEINLMVKIVNILKKSQNKDVEFLVTNSNERESVTEQVQIFKDKDLYDNSSSASKAG